MNLILEMKEDILSTFVDWSTEFLQPVQQRGNTVKNNHNLRDLWDNNTRFNIHILESQKKKIKMGMNTYLNMAKNFPILTKYKNLQI